MPWLSDLTDVLVSGPSSKSGAASSAASSAGVSSSGGSSSGAASASSIIYSSSATAESVGLILAGLLFFSFLLEISTRGLEKWLAKKHLLVVLILCYKEAMIVGLCTVMLYFEKQYKWIDWMIPGGFDYKVFKKIDISMFICVLVYILILCGQMWSALRFVGSLRQMEARLEYVNPTLRVDSLKSKIAAGGLSALGARFSLAAAEWELEYAEVRSHFLAQHKLPVDFPMYLYLRKATREGIQAIAGIHWNVWVFVLLFAFLTTVRVQIFGEDRWGGTIEYFVVVYLSLFFSAMLYFKIRSIKKSVLAMRFSASQTIGHDPSIHGGAHGAGAHAENDHHDDDEHGHDAHGHGHGDQPDSPELAAHKALFWAKSPGLAVKLIQFTTLAQAIAIPVYLIFFSKKWTRESPEVASTLSIFAILPALIVLYFLKSMLPDFIFVTSVGALSRKDFIEETKQETPSIQGNIKLID